MNAARFALTVTASLAAACAASAHSELPSATWCSDGVVRPSGSFSFSPAQLHAEFDRRQLRRQRCLQQAGLPDHTPAGESTCGIFDPPYEMAVALARAACGAPASPVPAHESAIVAFVVAPQAFNDPDHHITFNFDAGLSGLCGICITHAAPIDTPPLQN